MGVIRHLGWGDLWVVRYWSGRARNLWNRRLLNGQDRWVWAAKKAMKMNYLASIVADERRDKWVRSMGKLAFGIKWKTRSKMWIKILMFKESIMNLAHRSKYNAKDKYLWRTFPNCLLIRFTMVTGHTIWHKPEIISDFFWIAKTKIVKLYPRRTCHNI